MGKPESLTKKKEKPKPPVSTAVLSESHCCPAIALILGFNIYPAKLGFD